MKDIRQIVAEFKKFVEVLFKKKYETYTPILSKIVGSFNVGACSASNVIFDMFMDGLKEVFGVVPTETMPQSYEVIVKNKDFGKKVVVTRRDFLRAQSVENLDLKARQIESLATLAKDHPVEQALSMIESGASSTYGTCYDGKNLFATDHYFDTAINQSNLLTGTGATQSYVLADLEKAIDALHGFCHPQGNRLRKFNNDVKPLVICPTQMRGIFEKIQKADMIGSTSNTLKGTFDFVTEAFADANDFYVIDVNNGGNPVNAPIINPVEEAPVLTDNDGQESAVMDGQYKWQVLYSGGYAYGAWWKIVKVANS